MLVFGLVLERACIGVGVPFRVDFHTQVKALLDSVISECSLVFTLLK